MSQETDAPVPMKRGRFSLYEKPDGGYHIAYTDEMADEPVTEHIDIPGPIVKMAKAAAEGKMSPMKMMAKMMGGG